MKLSDYMAATGVPVAKIGTIDSYNTTVIFAISGVEGARLDDGRRLLVGTANPIAVGGTTPGLQVAGAGGPAVIISARFSNDANAGGINIGKSRSATVGGLGIVANNDILGAVNVYGADGTQFVHGGYARWEVEGTPGVSNMPTRFVVGTRTTGWGNAATRLVVDSYGRLLVGLTSAVDGSGITVANVTNTGVIASIAICDGLVGNQAPRIKFVKGRSGTPGGTGGAIASGDIIGLQQFIGDKGDSTLTAGGQLFFFAEAGWTTTSVPTAFQIDLAPSGSAVASAALRVDSTGFLSLNGDTNTGLRRVQEDMIALRAGGVDFLKVVNGHVWIGTLTAHVQVNGYNSAVQHHSSSNSSWSRGYWAANAAGIATEYVKSRGASVGTNAAVVANDLVRQSNYWADHGAGLALIALNSVEVASISGTTVRGRFRWYIRDEFNTTQEAFRISETGGIFMPRVGTTASAANAFLDSGSSPANQLLRSTSSRVYKHAIEALTAEDEAIVDRLRPITYRSLAQADLANYPDRVWIGLIAEEVAEADPRLVHYRRLAVGGPLVPDGVQYDRIVVPLVSRVQRHGGQIAALEAEVAALQAELAALKAA